MKTNECRGPGDRAVISIPDGIVPFDGGNRRTTAVGTASILVNQPGTIQDPVFRDVQPITQLGESRETPTNGRPPVDSDRPTIPGRKTEDDR